jgi:hypothetical protein
MTTPEPEPVPTDDVPRGESGWPYATAPTTPQHLLDIAARRFFGADPGEPMAVSLEAAVTEVLAAAEKQIRARIADDIEAAQPLDTGCTENVLIGSGLATAARIARSER